MRSLVAVPAAAVLLAGTSAATVVATAKPASAAPASASAASALPSCPGVRVMRQPIYTNRKVKAAYIHVFYDKRTGRACAFVNSTYATWGIRKHMSLRLWHCVGLVNGYCLTPLATPSRSGWYSGRSGTLTVNLSKGCVKAVGTVSWGGQRGESKTKAFCVRSSGGWV